MVLSPDAPIPRVASLWQSAQTETVQAAGTIFAYRRLGPQTGTPLIMLNHWGGVLDHFDPAIVAPIAAVKPLIAVDYRGVGTSAGQAPLTVATMAADMIALIRALGHARVDLFGFSLGGFVAQDILRQAPELIGKAILAGTGPAGGSGIAKIGCISWPLILKAVFKRQDPKSYLFFPAHPNGRHAADAFFQRLKTRRSDPDIQIKPTAFLRQLRAIHAWGRQPAQDLTSIQTPVLVVNGDQDIMIPSRNTIDLAQRFPNAELVLYPDAGHGGIFQHHDAFTQKAVAFLMA